MQMPLMTEKIHLTPRERQIIQAVARGLSNRAIASELRISEQTVKNQLTVLYDKVGVESRLQLALYAVRGRL